MENITEACLTSKENFRSMLLPKNLPFYHENSEAMLVIYANYPKLTRITCYPIIDKEIWVIRLSFINLHESQVAGYDQIIQNYHVYHTTGVQEKRSEYVIESYFSLDEEKLPRKQLKELIEEFPGVSSFELEKIQFQ